MKYIVFVITFIPVLMFSSKLPNIEVSPTVSRVLTDSSLPFNNYTDYGLSISKKISEEMMINLSYNRGELDYVGSTSSSIINTVSLNPEYYFYNEDNIQLFGTAGVSHKYISKKLFNAKNKTFFNYGAGIKYQIVDRLNVFLKTIHHTTFDNDNNYFHITAGFGFTFGKNENKIEEKPTPKIVKPKKTKKPNYIVTKYKDNDRDGVINKKDICPNTPIGFRVDKKGCKIGYNFLVKFESSSWVIPNEYLYQIKKFAIFLKNNPGYKNIEIAGHADSSGNKYYNKTLSEKRAKAVYEKLIEIGIKPSRLSYAGYGDIQPLVSNDTKEGRAQNRRIEANFQ